MSSEVASRGRSSTRGRGSFRGRGSRKPNGSAHEPTQIQDDLDDQGEIGELKLKYKDELATLKDLFPQYSPLDLVLALDETSGQLEVTIDHISQGNVSQFAEVKSGKDRARSKVKEDPAKASAIEKSSTGVRGGRARGDGTRTRGSQRARGGMRGGRGGHAAPAVTAAESGQWDTPASKADAPEPIKDSPAESKEAEDGESAWSNVVNADSVPAAASEGAKPSLLPEKPKSWASMFKQTAPAPVPKKPTQVSNQPSQLPPADPVAQGQTPAAEEAPPASKAPEPADTPSVEGTAAEAIIPAVQEPPSTAITSGEPPAITTAKPDPLTEENVEHLPDESHPPATQTVASTTGSVDPRNLTPLPGAQAPIGRPPVGGYAATAARATSSGGRSASFQRRVQEQQEAVVMPGHNAVDRAAVQFGSMGLNGDLGSDVDEDREDPETRQAPQTSPPSQPRTSLPPVSQNPAVQDGQSIPKAAPGLPPASQQNQQQVQNAMSQTVPQEVNQMPTAYNQYGGYGQVGMQQDSLAQQQKPYDAFGQQPQPTRYDQFGAQPPTTQPQASQGFGGLSSAGYDYSAYQTADAQRNAYNQYYGGAYAQHDPRVQAQQEAGMSQQRASSGFGGVQSDAFGSQPQPQARYGDSTGSGHNTPNPLSAGQQQQQQPQQQGPNAQSQHALQQQPGQQQQQQQPQQHQQQQVGYGAGFPYGHPYYSSPYQQAYQNQFGYSHQGGGYGGFPSKQAGMYGGSHGYGAMGPQASYEQHSSSPANTGAFGPNQGNTMRSASGMGGLGGLEEYGRTSAQGSHPGGGFGGINDPFTRSTSGLGTQGGYGQHGATAPEDSLKSFNDAKSGQPPALGQPGRPGSAAANNNATASQSNLPPAQSHQSGFGAAGSYPGFQGQGSQYSGLGGLGTHGQGQSGGMGNQAGYGGYGGFSQTYGGYGSRGGWGQSYGGH